MNMIASKMYFQAAITNNDSTIIHRIKKLYRAFYFEKPFSSWNFQSCLLIPDLRQPKSFLKSIVKYSYVGRGGGARGLSVPRAVISPVEIRPCSEAARCCAGCVISYG